MNRRKKWTREAILQLIRRRERELGRVPGTMDIPIYVRNIYMPMFGSWSAAVKEATGKDSKYKLWTDEEIFSDLKSLRAKHGCIPTPEIVGSIPRLKESIRRRYGSLNDGLELALGLSPRTDCLRALGDLGPGAATTYEIADLLAKKGSPTSIHGARAFLNYWRNRKLVLCEKPDRIALWKLTEAGRVRVKELKA